MVASGQAKMHERHMFSDRMLNDADIYRRVSNMQKVWKSLSSDLPQLMARRLTRALELCDNMRIDMERNAAVPDEASGSGSAPESTRQATGGPARDDSAGQSRGKSARKPDQADEEMDLIELVARNKASERQVRDFIRQFQNDRSFKHQIMHRDRTYLTSKSSEGYKKAAMLRIWTGQQSTTLLSSFPWSVHLEEGFSLAEASLNKKVRSDMARMFADRCRLLEGDSAGVSTGEAPRQSRQGGRGQGRGSPAERRAEARGKGPASAGLNITRSPPRGGKGASASSSAAGSPASKADQPGPSQKTASSVIARLSEKRSQATISAAVIVSPLDRSSSSPAERPQTSTQQDAAE
jgi:hypothetical protein